MDNVEFYFDFSSPNAYFSAVQLDRLQEENPGVTVDWKPVFLGGIMNELETTPPAMQNELKAEYMRKDMMDWSDEYDIPFEFPEEFPVNSLDALRAFIAIAEESSENAREFARAVFREAWVNRSDISDWSVISDSLPSDLDEPSNLEDKVSSEEIKGKLKQLTDDAVDRGVFGCPTFFVDDEMFWGKDRFDFVRRRVERGG